MGTMGWLMLGLGMAWVWATLKTTRPDGIYLRNTHPFRVLMGYIMPTRNESVVYFDVHVRAERLLAYVEKARKKYPVDITHCLVAAAAQAMHGCPNMNRFVVGRRVYQRKNVDVTFSMKRKKRDKGAKLSAVKTRIPADMTFLQLCEAISGNIKHERSGEKTYADKELGLLFRLPRPVLRIAVTLLRTLDYYNLLPAAFIEGDGMYTSMFVANLGSVDMDSGYHHLYEWGTCPLFMMAGKIEDRPVVEDGKVVVGKTLHMRFSFDERIGDGQNANVGILRVKALLEDPERWLGSVDGDGDSKEAPTLSATPAASEASSYERFVVNAA